MTPQPNPVEPVREIFLAVPIDSDFGFTESKNGCWVSAYEKKEGAEDMARFFESGGIKHQVIRFTSNDPALCDEVESLRTKVKELEGGTVEYMVTSKYLNRPLMFTDKKKAFDWYEPRKDCCEIHEVVRNKVAPPVEPTKGDEI